MRDEQGFSLVEVLVAMVVLGAIAVTFLAGVGAASSSAFIADRRETGRNLAESQMEYVKAAPYAPTYAPAPIGADYAGYSVSISTDSIQDAYIQKITILVDHQGAQTARLESYKVK
jgi:prepilin-type N-terminal cleavage/methylation domain-containing protein